MINIIKPIQKEYKSVQWTGNNLIEVLELLPTHEGIKIIDNIICVGNVRLGKNQYMIVDTNKNVFVFSEEIFKVMFENVVS